MGLLTANFVSKGKARREMVGGREFLVVPLVSMVEGVLHGSKGPLYYPGEEIENSTQSWDGVPLVRDHPTTIDGSPLSAKDHGVYDRQGLGHIKSSTSNATKDGVRLKHEGWFDVEKTTKVDPRIVQSLNAGTPIELSTGLYTDNHPAPYGSEYKGRPYTHIARNYRPDHMAILPDQVGACSINDGCGVLINRKGIPIMVHPVVVENAEDGGSDEEDDDLEDCQEDCDGDEDCIQGCLDDMTGNAMGGTDAPEDDEEETEEDGEMGVNRRNRLFSSPETKLIRYERVPIIVINAALYFNRNWPQSKRDNLAKKDFAGPHESFPITSQTDVDSAAKLTGHADDPEAVKSKIKSIAKKRGLKVPESWATNEFANLNPLPSQGGGNTPSATLDKESPMEPEHDASKGAMQASLATEHMPAREPALAAVDASSNDDNGAAAKFHKQAAGIHEKAATDCRKTGQASDAMDHDYAAAQHRKAASMQSAVMNANKEITQIVNTVTNKGGSTVTFNRKQALAKLTANCTCQSDKAALNALSDKMLAGLLKNEKSDSSDEDVTGDGSIQAGGEEDDDSDDKGMAKKAKSGVSAKSPAMNQRRIVTTQEWLDQSNAPREVRDLVSNGLAERTEKKKVIVRKLVANAAQHGLQEAQLTALTKKLISLPLSDLQERELLIPPTINTEREFTITDGENGQSFVGNTGGGDFTTPAQNRRGDDDGELLMVPTLNWQEVSEENRGITHKQQKQTA